MPKLPKRLVNWKHPEEIRLITEDIRKNYGNPSENHHKNVDLIVDRMGIGWDSFLSPNRSNVAFLTSDLSAICVNQYFLDRINYNIRMTYVYNFAIAHEIGHYSLHKEIYLNSKYKSLNEYLSFIQSINDADYRNAEWQANMFAGLLLVPRDELIKECMDLIKNNTEGRFQKLKFLLTYMA